MSYEQFQQKFEQMADAEARRFDAMSVAALASEIGAGNLGEYYQAWYSLARRAKPAEVNALLFSFLSSEAEYLQRYHCAAALIQINKLDWEPQDLSAGPKHLVAEKLQKVREQLNHVQP